MYKVADDNSLVVIPYKVINKVLEWNTDYEKRGDEQYDRKICQMLLISLASKNDIRESKISKEAIEFIKACFIVRVDDKNEERIAAIDTYIRELCTEKAKKAAKAAAETSK